MPVSPGLVVVGQGAAGTAAAKAFRELLADAPITLITAEGHPCYARPRLPEIVAGKALPQEICLYQPDWYAQQGIRLVLGQTVTQLDLTQQRVLTAEGQVYPYSRLVLATGAEALQPGLPGLPSPRVTVLRTLDDALQLNQLAQGKRTALLIGGGLLGLEVGHALTQLKLQVIVIEQAPRLLPRQVDEEGSTLLQEKLVPQGFRFVLGTTVARVRSTVDQVQLRLADGVEIAGDLAVVSAGIRPRIELAAAAGLALGQRGIQVDDHLGTSQPHVYAAGDCAEWHGQVAGLWPAAQAMGRVAGANAGGADQAYPGLVPSTKLKVAGVDLMSQGDIRAEGAQVISQRPAPGQLCKLFIRDGRLAGSIQIGRTHGWPQLKRLMELQLPVAGFETRLLEDDFDFKRIPGF